MSGSTPSVRAAGKQTVAGCVPAAGSRRLWPDRRAAEAAPRQEAPIAAAFRGGCRMIIERNAVVAPLFCKLIVQCMPALTARAGVRARHAAFSGCESSSLDFPHISTRVAAIAARPQVGGCRCRAAQPVRAACRRSCYPPQVRADVPWALVRAAVPEPRARARGTPLSAPSVPPTLSLRANSPHAPSPRAGARATSATMAESDAYLQVELMDAESVERKTDAAVDQEALQQQASCLHTRASHQACTRRARPPPARTGVLRSADPARWCERAAAAGGQRGPRRRCRKAYRRPGRPEHWR